MCWGWDSLPAPAMSSDSKSDPSVQKIQFPRLSKSKLGQNGRFTRSHSQLGNLHSCTFTAEDILNFINYTILHTLRNTQILINRIDSEKLNFRIFHKSMVCKWWKSGCEISGGCQITADRDLVWPPLRLTLAQWLPPLYGKSEPFGEKIQFEIWTNHEVVTRSQNK